MCLQLGHPIRWNHPIQSHDWNFHPVSKEGTEADHYNPRQCRRSHRPHRQLSGIWR